MIKIENLKKTYDKGTKHANEVLHGISLTLPDTGFVCILGESGCGKTSLLNAIGGLDLFDSGTITTDGAIIKEASSREMERERNASFGYIFQNYYLLSEHSVAYNVYLGLHSLPLSEKEKLARVKDALSRVDMLRYRKRPVGELSGGQQQRVAIARAIARRPRVIFADEPTGNLDEANTMNICSILKELSLESLVVMVTHEERIARFFADRIITLDNGQIISDKTDWTRSALDAGAKDTLYSGDYSESTHNDDSISLRLLRTDDAKGVDITVIADADRIIIKVNDPRIVLCSESTAAPFLVEGERPVISSESFKKVDGLNKSSASEAGLARKSGLGFGMLWREVRSLTSGKKLRRAGTGIFTVLLSAMLSLALADVITVSHINPEDFITTDSHTLTFNFERGAAIESKYASIDSYVQMYRQHLKDSQIDADYIPMSSNLLKYTDSSISQLGNVSIEFGKCSWARISRLDESKLIAGRMPERSDEIVIDRWVLDAALREDGILQNIIPNPEYLLGKQLTSDRVSISPTIVGICDSGEPTIYMSTEMMLALGAKGVEVITASEYNRITGSDISGLGLHECVVLSDNAGSIYSYKADVSLLVKSGYTMISKYFLRDTDDSIGAKLIIADEALEPMFEQMMISNTDFTLWCADKDAVYSVLDASLPSDLAGKLDIKVSDVYSVAYAEYEASTAAKLDARTIVTVTVILISAIMLYLMQRSKLRERMDILSVYRLLGIPKKNLLLIFTLESLVLTLTFALPTVFVTWLVLKISTSVTFMSAIAMIFPLWAALATLLAIAAFRILVATLPVLRLLSQPPARLAAKYDL